MLWEAMNKLLQFEQQDALLIRRRLCILGAIKQSKRLVTNDVALTVATTNQIFR
jgi:hypothetical protein